VWVLRQAPRVWSKSPVTMVRTNSDLYWKTAFISCFFITSLLVRTFSISFLYVSLFPMCANCELANLSLPECSNHYQWLKLPLRKTSCCQLSKQCFEQGMWCLQGLQGRLCSVSSVHNSQFCWKKTPYAVTSLRSHFILDLSSDISVISCAVSLRHRLSLAMCQTTWQSIVLLFSSESSFGKRFTGLLVETL